MPEPTLAGQPRSQRTSGSTMFCRTQISMRPVCVAYEAARPSRSPRTMKEVSENQPSLGPLHHPKAGDEFKNRPAKPDS